MVTWFLYSDAHLLWASGYSPPGIHCNTLFLINWSLDNLLDAFSHAGFDGLLLNLTVLLDLAVGHWEWNFDLVDNRALLSLLLLHDLNGFDDSAWALGRNLLDFIGLFLAWWLLTDGLDDLRELLNDRRQSFLALLELVNFTAVGPGVWAFDDPLDVIALLSAYWPFDLSDDFVALGLDAVLLLWDLYGLDLIFADLDDLNDLLRDVVWHLDVSDLLLADDLSLDARFWAHDHHDSLSLWLALSWHDFPLLD